MPNRWTIFSSFASRGTRRSLVDETAESRLAFLEPSFDFRAFAWALLTVAGAVGVALMLWPAIGLENVDLVFLTAVVGVAVRLGLWPSLLASVVSSLCYNFFFTAPYYTFTISEPASIVSVLFFTIVAVIVSNVAARARAQALSATARARTTELLYTFSRKLAGVGTLDDVLWATAYQTALMLNVRVVLLLPENGAIVVKAGYPPEDQLDQADLAAAQWVWQSDAPARSCC
jgi:two-component system sensor histidine kinase KdpD